MNNTTIFQKNIQGFRAVGLRSKSAELVLVSELGGRIVSLRSLKTGREWLWHQDRPDWLWANKAGDNFGISPQAGIDECFPSVAKCDFKKRHIPDHGELWYRAWTLDQSYMDRNVLKSVIALDVSPFVFGRAVSVETDGTFLFQYSIENLGTEEEPYIWSLHPLKNIAEGDQIYLSPEVYSLRLDGGLGVPISRGDVWSYPEPFPGIRLDACQVPGLVDERCVKGFAGPLRTGWAAIRNQHTGDQLELLWDTAEVPYLGLWINRGLGGFHHVALEPCTGIPDSLDVAVRDWNQVKTIKSGEKKNGR